MVGPSITALCIILNPVARIMPMTAAVIPFKTPCNEGLPDKALHNGLPDKQLAERELQLPGPPVHPKPHLQTDQGGGIRGEFPGTVWATTMMLNISSGQL